MSKRYSGKSFKDSSVMKKPKLTFKEKRKLKGEKKRKDEKTFWDCSSGLKGAFCCPVSRTALLKSLGKKLNIINIYKFYPKCFEIY